MLAVAGFGLAQDEVDLDDFSSMSLEDLLNVEVTVASKSEETIADAPSSVTVFTRQEILNMGITSLEELLNYTPGFFSQRQISYGSSWTVQARGKDEGGYLSKEVLVLKDGLRLNDYFTGGSSFVNRTTTLDDVKQIEIIRGPGSALYGSNAFLGVINIVTNDKVNYGSVKFGRYDSRDASVNFHKDFNDWAISGFARTYSDNGEEYFITQDFFGRMGETADPADALDASVKVSWKSLTLRLGYTERDQHDFQSGIAIGGENISQNEQEQTRIGFNWKPDLGEKFSLELSAGHVTADMTVLWHWPEILGPDQALDFGLFVDQFNSNFNADFSYQFYPKNTISFGASYERRGIDDNAIIGRANSQITFFRGDAGVTENETQTVYAVYVQDQHKFSKWLKLVVGVRHDDYNDFGGTTNPRGGLIFTAGESGNKFKILYGQAFRAASNSERFQRNTLAAFGVPDLTPEEVKTLEGVWVGSWKAIQVTATYFINEITNVITTIPLADTATQTIYINQGTDDTEGLELELRASLGPKLLLRAAYTDQTKTSDQWSPDKYGSAILNLHHNWLNINLNGTYHNTIPELTNQGTVILLNLAARFEIREKFNIQLGIQNLTDEIYESPDAPFTDTGIRVPNRPLSYSAGFSVTF
jgi:outer membrane receptor protein involved in Fe transport